MNSGELCLVNEKDLLYGYIFSDDNHKNFTRVKVETGVYLVIKIFPDKFYEILVDKKIVMVKLEDKFIKGYS
jgi:hypothetical protein